MSRRVTPRRRARPDMIEREGMRREPRRRGRPPQPLNTFRLVPEPERPGGLYVLVRVWPTLAAMHEAVRWHGGSVSARARGYAAGIVSIDVDRRGRERVLPVCADVHLTRGHLGTEVVVHEMTHAALAWARRVRFPFEKLTERPVNEHEERLAYAVGELAKQFVRRADAAGLYRPGDLTGGAGGNDGAVE